MKVWEAYCDIKLRNTFKHEYLVAQGLSPSSAQEVMTKYKIYIDRFNGIPDILEIREIRNVPEMMVKLDHIFQIKWKNHIKENYRDMPMVFMQYGRFLQAENERRKKTLFENSYVVSQSDKEYKISDYEHPYIDKEGKLRIIANPFLISLLKQSFNKDNSNMVPCLEIIKTFYGSQLMSMTDSDWLRLIQKLFINNEEKTKSKTGARKAKIHLKMADVVDQIVQPIVALSIVCTFVGKEDVSKLRLEMKGMPLLTKHVPIGKEKYYCSIDNGWYLNACGDVKEKLRIIRMLSVFFKIKISTEIVI